MIRLSHIEKTYFGKGNETHALGMRTKSWTV